MLEYRNNGLTWANVDPGSTPAAGGFRAAVIDVRASTATATATQTVNVYDAVVFAIA
jgi:hypothetical protein